MKLFKIVFLSSLMILLSGCEELGIDLSQTDIPEDVTRENNESASAVFENDVMIEGLEQIEVTEGMEFDLEKGVEVVGVEDYNLRIASDPDMSKPGEYVVYYYVYVGDELVSEAKRMVVVKEKDISTGGDFIDIQLVGIDELRIKLGTEYDLEKGVMVKGVEKYELKIDDTVDPTTAGEYVVHYKVIVDDEVVLEAKRLVNVLDPDSDGDSIDDTDMEKDSVRYLIHRIGDPIDGVCGVDDDCDGIDFTRAGIVPVKRVDKSTPLLMVMPNDVIDEEMMRFWQHRKLAEEELKALEVVGELYTINRHLIGPLNNDYEYTMLREWIPDLTDEEMKHLMVLDEFFKEVAVEMLRFKFGDLDDDGLMDLVVCMADSDERITIVEPDEDSTTRAKEKANRTKCRSVLKTYFETGLGVDEFIYDELRNSKEVFKSEDFVRFSNEEIEQELGRPLTEIEKEVLDGLDNDCDGIDQNCDGVDDDCNGTDYMVCGLYDRFKVLLNTDKLTEEQMMLIPYLNVEDFVTQMYDPFEVYMEQYGLTEETREVYTEMLSMSLIREVEQGFGGDLGKDVNFNPLATGMASRFKAGSDLSGKVNARMPDSFFDIEVRVEIEEIFSFRDVRKPMQDLINRVYGPGDAHYGSITFRLGRDLTEEEIIALHSIRYMQRDYYDAGGSDFLDASADQLAPYLKIELEEAIVSSYTLFQATMDAQDYNSSRSNNTNG